MTSSRIIESVGAYLRMSRRTLIILSKVYPYYPEFMQNEVDSIEANYDRVFVFCCSARKKDKLSQRVGEKYLVFRRNETQLARVRYAKYTILGVFRLFQRMEFRNEFKVQKGIRGKIAAIYSAGRVGSELAYVKKHLNKIEFEHGEKVIVYSYWFTDTATVAALLKKDFPSIRIFSITRAHGGDLYENRNISGTIPFRHFCLNYLDAVFPCSMSGEVYLKKKYPKSKSIIEYAYLGVKDHGVNPDQTDKVFRIVSCSNIIPLKRIDLIAEAMIEIGKRRIGSFEWVCIGGGSEVDHLKSMCQNAENISIVFKGAMSNEKVFDFYKTVHIDAFINTSSSEGLPVSIMETQSMGIPAIATDVGGTTEIVLDNKTGFILPSMPTIDEVVGVIMKLYFMEAEEKEALRKRCRKNYMDRFNSDENYMRFHQKMNRLMDCE